MIVDLPCSAKGCARRSRRVLDGRRWCELHGPTSRIRVLFKRQGENSTTPPDPVGAPPSCPLELAEKLAEVGRFCLSFDDDRLVELPVYEVHEIEVPWGMTAEAFSRDGVGLKWWRGYGGPDLAEPAMGRLARLNGAEKWHAAKLLKTDPARMRSDFRKRMREKVLAWATADEQVGAGPLLPQEVAALENDYERAARERADRRIYAAR